MSKNIAINYYFLHKNVFTDKTMLYMNFTVFHVPVDIKGTKFHWNPCFDCIACPISKIKEYAEPLDHPDYNFKNEFRHFKGIKHLLLSKQIRKRMKKLHISKAELAYDLDISCKKAGFIISGDQVQSGLQDQIMRNVFRKAYLRL